MVDASRNLDHRLCDEAWGSHVGVYAIVDDNRVGARFQARLVRDQSHLGQRIGDASFLVVEVEVHYCHRLFHNYECW